MVVTLSKHSGGRRGVSAAENKLKNRVYCPIQKEVLHHWLFRDALASICVRTSRVKSWPWTPFNAYNDVLFSEKLQLSSICVLPSYSAGHHRNAV
ncbi:unnamed protein product [Nesidiocoris tenuis]|uniref:Uncharacterized protein n=1 Tax=Nesidiocoris tenuis TaxID=355587 RepID=A0A6H5HRF7_9HEMI|nr:unnamed protein product [Nesidiocoris tenuis]